MCLWEGEKGQVFVIMNRPGIWSSTSVSLSNFIIIMHNHSTFLKIRGILDPMQSFFLSYFLIGQVLLKGRQQPAKSRRAALDIPAQCGPRPEAAVVRPARRCSPLPSSDSLCSGESCSSGAPLSCLPLGTVRGPSPCRYRCLSPLRPSAESEVWRVGKREAWMWRGTWSRGVWHPKLLENLSRQLQIK